MIGGARDRDAPLERARSRRRSARGSSRPSPGSTALRAAAPAPRRTDGRSASSASSRCLRACAICDPMRLRRDASADAAAAINAPSPSSRAIVERAESHRQGLVEVELVHPVHGQLDLDALAASTDSRSGRSSQARDQTPVGVVVAPEPVLDGGAPRRQLDASADGGLRRTSSIASSSVEPAQRRARRPTAVPTRARRARRPGGASSSLGSSAAPHSNHRAAAAGARGRGGLPGRQQERDRLLVARSGRLLDVMRALARPAPRASSATAPARAPPGASRPASPRRRLGAPADGGS